MITTFGILTEATGQEHLTKNCSHVGMVHPTREHFVCYGCGLVMNTLLFYDDSHPNKNKQSKPYKPIHHFSERIAQWTATGPVISDQFFLEILRQHLSGVDFVDLVKWGPATFASVIKCIDKKYKVNYSCKKYHERWVWLRNYFNIEPPPYVPDELIKILQIRYIIVHRAFKAFTEEFFVFEGLYKKRKNIININYVMLNCLKQEKRPEYYKYFANIKGWKSNWSEIKLYWGAIKQVMIIRYESLCHIGNVVYEIRWDEPDITLEEINASQFYS